MAELLERNKPVRALLTSKPTSNQALSHVPLIFLTDQREKLRSVQLISYGYLLCQYDQAPGFIVAHVNNNMRRMRRMICVKGEPVEQCVAHFPFVFAVSESRLFACNVELGQAVSLSLPPNSTSGLALIPVSDHMLYGVSGDGNLFSWSLNKFLDLMQKNTAEPGKNDDDDNDSFVLLKSSLQPVTVDMSGAFQSSSCVLSPTTRLSKVVSGVPEGSGDHLLVGSYRAIQVWDIPNKRLLLHGEPGSETTTFAISAARYGSVVTVDSMEVRIFTYNPLAVNDDYHSIPKRIPHPAGTVVTQVHVDDSFVFLGSSTGKVSMLDRVRGNLVRDLVPAANPLSSSALSESPARGFSVDTSRRCNVLRRMGKYVLCAWEDGRFEIRDVRQENELEPPVAAYENNGNGPIKQCVISPGGVIIFSLYLSSQQIHKMEKKQAKSVALLTKRPEIIVWRPRFDIAALLEEGENSHGVNSITLTHGQILKSVQVKGGGVLGALSFSCARVGTLLTDFAVHYPKSDVDELATTCESMAKSVARAYELSQRGIKAVDTPLLFQAQTVLDEYESAILRLRSTERLSRFLGSTRLRHQIEQLNARLAKAADAIEASVEPEMAKLPKNEFISTAIEEEEEEEDEEEDVAATAAAGKSILSAAEKQKKDQDQKKTHAKSTSNKKSLSVTASMLWNEAAGGKRARTVAWPALADVLTKSSDYKKGTKGLQYLLDPCNTGFVSKFKFCEMLRAFGPVHAVCKNVERLFSESWFHGYLSSKESELLLLNRDRGSFLVRLSRSSPGSLALAFVAAVGGSQKKEVRHTLLTVARPRGFKVEKTGADNTREEKFPTLWALIDHLTKQNLLTRTVSPLSFSPWFAGDLSRVETDELLQGKRAGTFLIRFSSSDNANYPFTLSFVTPNNQSIRHVRLTYDGQNYSVQNEPAAGHWPELQQFVQAWTQKEANKVRQQFRENVTETNPARISHLINSCETKLKKWAHPDPYILPTNPGGSKYQRNVPPPPSFKFVEYPSESHSLKSRVDSE